MAASRTCAECGTELAVNSPQGLCPQCMLRRVPHHSSGVTIFDTENTVIESEPCDSRAGAAPREGGRFGDYQLIRWLGQGGMGVVYEAEHLPSERRVALKVLTHRLDSAEARKRFLREGQLAASVNHPNSVYVFGTEEIDGVPVISMELAPGGTLKDRVKEKGPLLITDAVDVTLQVIAGLESAEAKGVLHRDVKPSNCFVDTDAKVKVGDFGLSLSTLVRGDTQLTMSGTFLGTPTFSSPEQLRGDELDVRSDIYSVGVTLYYLLTGRTPFEGDNLVKLLATVLERPAESPAKLRREVPQELARVVLQCLEKQPANRFRTYDELRSALSMFSSAAPTPASLALRFRAGIIDSFYCWLFGLVCLGLIGQIKPLRSAFQVSGIQVSGDLIGVLIYFTFFSIYYGLLEGLWGATPGKSYLHLRVVSRRGKAAGAPRGFFRALIYLAAPLVPTLIPFAFSLDLDPAQTFFLVLALWWSFTWVLFCTARRSNGFAGLHDLLTQTRVVLEFQPQLRPVLLMPEVPVPAGEAMSRFGPYQVLSTLRKNETDELLLGHDARLLRKVWIRKFQDGTPPPRSKLRDLSRTGRLRWMNGKRATGDCWDAYEAPSGKPLLTLLNQRQPWERVRYWLWDLAEELSASSQDRTLPEVLNLDRVWITADNRAKLLDFPAPEIELSSSENASGPNSSAASTQETTLEALRFLKQVALSALEGRPIDLQEAETRKVTFPMALHARTYLNDFLTFPTLDVVLNALKPLLFKPAVVSRPRRFRLMASLLLSFFIMTSLGFLIGLERQLDVAKAGARFSWPTVLREAAKGAVLWSFFFIPCSLISSLFRGSLALHRLELAFVCGDGTPAGPGRILIRSFVIWVPAASMAGLMRVPDAAWLVTFPTVLVLVGVVWSILTPERTLQDRIAGTWLVPR